MLGTIFFSILACCVAIVLGDVSGHIIFADWVEKFQALDYTVRLAIILIPGAALVLGALLDLIKIIANASIKRLQTKAELALKLRGHM